MNNFDIDQEIDALIDKVAEQLKMRLKKMVERNQKLVLKQYIASQKETSRKDTKPSTTKAPMLTSGRNSDSKTVAVRKGPRHKKDYDSSDTEDSD